MNVIRNTGRKNVLFKPPSAFMSDSITCSTCLRSVCNGKLGKSERGLRSNSPDLRHGTRAVAQSRPSQASSNTRSIKKNSLVNKEGTHSTFLLLLRRHFRFHDLLWLRFAGSWSVLDFRQRKCSITGYGLIVNASHVLRRVMGGRWWLRMSRCFRHDLGCSSYIS